MSFDITCTVCMCVCMCICMCVCVFVCVTFLFSFSVCYLFICISLQFGGTKVEIQLYSIWSFRLKRLPYNVQLTPAAHVFSCSSLTIGINLHVDRTYTLCKLYVDTYFDLTCVRNIPIAVS